MNVNSIVTFVLKGLLAVAFFNVVYVLITSGIMVNILDRRRKKWRKQERTKVTMIE
jgi:chromate transport protein ChrA